MKNMIDLNKKILMILVVSFCSVAVYAQSGNFKEKTIGHVYKISIPGYMVETNDLNDVATFQAQNTVKEAYVIVIEDSKVELKKAGMKFRGSKDFFAAFEKDFTDKTTKKGKLKNLKINGYKAVQKEIAKKVNNLDIVYLVTVVESKTHFYKVVCWTLADRKDKLIADYAKIAASLKD